MSVRAPEPPVSTGAVQGPPYSRQCPGIDYKDTHFRGFSKVFFARQHARAGVGPGLVLGLSLGLVLGTGFGAGFGPDMGRPRSGFGLV